MSDKVPSFKMTTAIPSSITTPDSVDSSIGTFEYFDGVPNSKTNETAYDFLDRSRAVNVFLNSLPMMSVATLRDGQRALGADACNKICIFDTLMDSKGLFLTGTRQRCTPLAFSTSTRMARRSSTCRPACSAVSMTWRSPTWWIWASRVRTRAKAASTWCFPRLQG